MPAGEYKPAKRANTIADEEEARHLLERAEKLAVKTRLLIEQTEQLLAQTRKLLAKSDVKLM
ncbi:MAG TPA: hypothetical protein VKB58_01075 [Terriglobales bacterium]|jgi:hypothetical protein|nr:hypothetical protein [Terriglobales bacterium]